MHVFFRIIKDVLLRLTEIDVWFGFFMSKYTAWLKKIIFDVLNLFSVMVNAGYSELSTLNFQDGVIFPD